MSTEPIQTKEKTLLAKLDANPDDWETRQQLAHMLYDQGAFDKAAVIIWEADQIPSTDLDLAFAARILSKAQPRKAIRLLTAMLEHNRGKAVQNLGIANALLHHGMVLQSARFYGAALEADPTLVNPDLEHFMLWTDDEQTLWGDFKNRRPKLGELPWMARDPMEALKLTSRISLHTTPIRVPNLPSAPGEELRNDLYQQSAEKNGKLTPPPAVTIPADRVDPKHRRFDSTYGAPDDPNAIAAEPVPEVPAAPAPMATPAPRTLMVPGAKPLLKPVSADAPPAPAPTAALTPTASGPRPLLMKRPGSATPQPMTSPAADAAALAEAQAAAYAEAQALAAAQAQALAEAQAQAVIEAQIRAEAEARIRIELEAKIRAEAEAKIRAETEARIRAEEEAKIKAEEEAKAQAEAEIKAAEEARIKAEEDARIRAEEEAKARVAEREAAKEMRLKAAASGVPLPSTEGRPGHWFYIMNGEACGPVLPEELREKLEDPSIVPPLKMIWTAGMTRWTPVYECPQLWDTNDSSQVYSSH